MKMLNCAALLATATMGLVASNSASALDIHPASSSLDAMPSGFGTEVTPSQDNPNLTVTIKIRVKKIGGEDSPSFSSTGFDL